MVNPDDDQITETERLIDRNRNTNWPDLKPKERAFCLEYVISYDINGAAKASKNTTKGAGQKLLRKPLIAAYIAHLQLENAVPNFITEDFIRTQYLNLIPMLSGQEAVAIVEKGYAFQAKKFHASELISVLKDLRKSVDGYTGENLNVNMSLPDMFRKAIIDNNE